MNHVKNQSNSLQAHYNTDDSLQRSLKQSYVSSAVCKEPTKTAVERLLDLSNRGVVGNAPEPDHDYVLGTTAASMREFETQLSLLRTEIESLSQAVRPYLPDSMYDCGGVGCGSTSLHYEAAGNLNSPTIQAYAELLNQIMDLRSDIRRISANIVI